MVGRPIGRSRWWLSGTCSAAGKPTGQVQRSDHDGGPQPMRELGLAMNMGSVTAIQRGSPAALARPPTGRLDRRSRRRSRAACPIAGPARRSASRHHAISRLDGAALAGGRAGSACASQAEYLDRGSQWSVGAAGPRLRLLVLEPGRQRCSRWPSGHSRHPRRRRVHQCHAGFAEARPCSNICSEDQPESSSELGPRRTHLAGRDVRAASQIAGTKVTLSYVRPPRKAAKFATSRPRPACVRCGAPSRR